MRGIMLGKIVILCYNVNFFGPSLPLKESCPAWDVNLWGEIIYVHG